VFDEMMRWDDEMRWWEFLAAILTNNECNYHKFMQMCKNIKWNLRPEYHDTE
jgi:hypothetical protein